MLEYDDISRIGVAVPRVINPGGDTCPRVVAAIRQNDYRFRGISHGDTLGHLIYTHPFQGLLVHRNKIIEVGTVYEDYFFNCDDLDWTLRLSDAAGIAYVNNAVVIHDDRNIERRYRILGMSISVIRREAIWKHYYSIRNYIRVLKVRRKPYHLIPLLDFIKNIFFRIFFGDFLFFFRVYVMALTDGFRGITGKRIPPGWQGEPLK
jgi:rhamnopyranosyl-N-acetylglucosaminyl-diphospho-decaprenol beta-1,3/1,4-galactofuranosyltransferase